MKRIAYLMIFLFFLSKLIYSNPVDPKYFSEIQFSENGWIIELYPIDWTGELDSVYLTSTTDTAFVKEGCLDPFNYCLLTIDSLKSDLHLNMENDTISIFLNLYDLTFPDDQIVLGQLAVDSSQSLSRKLEYGTPGIDFWYIDNSPTLGFVNDTENAMGIIHFQIIDELGNPIPSAGLYRGIEYIFGDSVFLYTDSIGLLDYEAYATFNSFIFMKDGYYDSDTSFFVAPENIYDITLMMRTRENSIETSNLETASSFYLSPAYPNPFNNLTNFSYRLPRDAFIILSVYSMTGSKVAELFKGYRYAGEYTHSWSADHLSSGVYIISLNAKRQMLQRKCLLIR